MGCCFSFSVHGIDEKPKLPVSSVLFTENKGQIQDFDGNPTPFVLFKTATNGVDMFITGKGLTYSFYRVEQEEEEREIKKKEKVGDDDENASIEWNRIDVELKGACIKRENVIKEGESAHFSQYFLAHCPNGISNVHDYEKIIIKEVYPGIDWVLYNSSEKGVKYDFIIHPNGDPGNIQLIYVSKKPVVLNDNGSLTLKTLVGKINEDAPISFMKGAEIVSRFKQIYRKKIEIDDDEGYETCIGFDFPNTDVGSRDGDLVIDPQLNWCTFFGGASYNGPMSVCNDAAGSTFILGYILNTGNFPVMNNNTFFQGSTAGSNDLVIVKLSPAGSLIWSTYYGGTQVDWPRNITCDNTGNIFLTGVTNSPNFPLLNAGTFFQGTIGSSQDAFIMKFDNQGNRLWATFYGGSSGDEGYSVVTDAMGQLFVVGNTGSSDFSLQNAGTFFQNTFSGVADGFILKFTNNGTRLWATFYGGTAVEFFYTVTVDGANNVFVGGYTASANFPTQNSGTFFQAAMSGGNDACIMKFDNAGNRIWATFYGGNFIDQISALDCDANGNVFATGLTQSSNFPTQNAGTYFQPTAPGGTGDVFVLKFDNLGNRLWATYFGGSGSETISTYDNIVVDPCNNIYIAFTTQSTNMPLMSACNNCYYNSIHWGLGEIFFAKFSNGGVFLWGSYFGGSGNDFRESTSVDNAGNFFAVGEFGGNANYPTVNPGGGAYYDPNNQGNENFYIARFFSPLTASNYTNTICPGNSATVNIANSCLNNATYTLLPGPVTQTNPVFLVSPSITTVYSVTASGLNSNSVVVTQSAMVTVSVAPAPVISPTVFYGTCSNPVTNSANLNITFNPTGNPSYTVSWNPPPANFTPVNSATASGLIPGINTVTVITAAGCSATATFSVHPNQQPANFIIANPNNNYTVTCVNPNVALTTSITNGIPLTFTWFPSCTASVVGTSMNFNQACTGMVIGTSSTGCQMTHTFTIYQDFTTPTIAVTPTVSTINCSSGGACFTLTSNLGPNVTTNWFQIVGTNTIYVGAAQGTINIFCSGQPGIYWGESVYNITGCRSISSVQVNASAGVPVFTVTSPTNFTIGCGSKSVTSMQVTNVITTPVPNVACNFTFMTPPVSSTPTTFTPNPNLGNITVPGIYVVYVQDQTNNCIASQSVNIIQNIIPPNVDFIQPLSVLSCKDPSMVLNGISSSTNTQITWTVPAIPSNSINPTANATVYINSAVTGATNFVTSLGVWTVGAIDNNNFCAASKTVQIVQDVRLPKFFITAQSNSVINCKNSDVVIVPVITSSLAVALVPTYVWHPPVGWGLPGSSFNTTAPGTHTAVSTSVVNGCTYVATYEVPSDLQPPDIQATNPFILDCNPTPTVMLTPSISGSTTGLTYSWTAPAGALTSNLNSKNLTSNAIGNYFLAVTNTINGCSAQAFYQVTEGGIKADFIAKPESGFAPLSVTFINTSATSTGSANIISTWGFGNGSAYQNITNTVLTSATYSVPGTYSVVLTVKKGTCVGKIVKTIEVLLPSTMEVPNVFTPNGDGANDIFKLRASSLKEVSIVIYDRWGRKVYELTSDTGNFAWEGKDQSGKNCADGVYVYVIKAIGTDNYEYEQKGNVTLLR